jgi:uncharacterized SAM-binding protein YcdF (DUF218 family)
LLAAAVAGVGLWALALAAIWAFDRTWPEDAPLPARADAIICLGGGMSYRGWEKPGPDSTRRARTCAELYRAGVAPRIVFTGAGHHISSAGAAMARVAIADGVPREAIAVEHASQSTIQNAVFSQPLLPPDARRVVLVSDAYHLPRAATLFHIFTPQEIAIYAARADYTANGSPRNATRGETIWREGYVVWANVARVTLYGAGRLFGIERETLVGWFN